MGTFVNLVGVAGVLVGVWCVFYLIDRAAGGRRRSDWHQTPGGWTHRTDD